MQKTWHTENPLACPMVVAINIIGGKWKPIILHMLSTGIRRFGELKKNIPPVSQKILTQQLRELELDGIVIRTVYPEVPPRVEYSLSAIGIGLVPVLDSLYQWGEAYSEIMGKQPAPMTVDNAARCEQ
jgi:DNA-binding HxlR family transcriptional regulator